MKQKLLSLFFYPYLKQLLTNLLHTLKFKAKANVYRLFNRRNKYYQVVGIATTFETERWGKINFYLLGHNKKRFFPQKMC